MEFLYHKERFYECPGSWNELSGKQLVRIIAVLASTEDSLPARIKLFKILMGWGWWKIVTICGLHRMANLDRVLSLNYIPPSFGRYFDNTERMSTAANELTQFLVEGNTLTVQLLPKVKGFYGPASKLANLRMGEFCFAEHHFLEWRENKEIARLNDLVATLYRPGKKQPEIGDNRVPFEPTAMPAYAKQIDHWPLPVKLAIAAFYDGCREELIAANKAVFEYESGEESTSLFGLWSVMRSVAKAGHFGKFDDVANEYVDTILMELAESIAEYEKQKADMEANKTNQD